MDGRDLKEIPEVAALDRGRALIRIPPETDIPVTPRVLRILETAAFRRLQRISQLGLVSLVYPGATHTRFQHSLGVYRMGLLYLKSLGEDDTFRERVSIQDAERFIVACLVHDIGHWPYCHPLEDLKLPGIPRHEALARELLCGDELKEILEEDWGMTPLSVADFLTPAKDQTNVLHNMLSGPIDVDKLDYLDRDSLHAGVPYGRNFDRQRLIHSLCLDGSGKKLAVSQKGRTAAEMMVFARYIMFSEVYWHHAVRSATAMLQRAVYECGSKYEMLPTWLMMSDEQAQQSLSQHVDTDVRQTLVDNLFGKQRRLFKRLVQYNAFQEPELHQQLARRPYPFLVRVSQCFAARLQSVCGLKVRATDLLIDAPPVKLEVQMKVDVRQSDGSYRQLAEVSPVVRALAEQQFDDVVKQVRIFIAPHLRDSLRSAPLDSLLLESIREST